MKAKRIMTKQKRPTLREIDGAADLGCPYFVMEYAPGMPITTFADHREVNITQRRELFTQFCDTISHAHQKATLHRDIKVGSVLARMEDGKLATKVIDFGDRRHCIPDRYALPQWWPIGAKKINCGIFLRFVSEFYDAA